MMVSDKKKLLFLFFVLLACCAAMAVWLIGYYGEERHQVEGFEQLRQITVQKTGPGTTVIQPETVSLPVSSEIPAEAVPEERLEPDIAALQALNGDCIGWIRIPGASIDYPVMLSSDNPEFYLKHNFEGEESSHGVPFADARCGPFSCVNTVVYGHQMADGSMFSELLHYADANFLESHRQVELYLPEGKKVYTVFAVLQLSGTVSAGAWSLFDSLYTPLEETIGWCGTNALLYIEPPEDADRLLTMVTCEYSQENGRLAVVAAA